MKVAALAGAVAGLALWCTAGSLDRLDTAAGPVRVAMLPPLWLAAVLALAGVAGVVVGIGAMARASSGRWRLDDPADGDVFLPLFATSALGLPFLPWLADLLPAWIVLAGPFVRLVWAATGVLVLRAAILRWRDARGQHFTVFRPAGTVMVLVASATLYGVVAGRLAGSALFPGGDEPHYLVIAQSLWRDGDFKIENNHRRGDTSEYFGRPLRPHYLTRGVDGEIYSVHPVGLPVLAAPIYALGGYKLVVAVLVLCAAGAATLAWRAASRVVDGQSATFGWLGVAMTAPWVFNSFTVYPEVPAALCVMAAFAVALRLGEVSRRGPLVRWLVLCGVSVALLPWFSSKYAAMGAALSAVIALRLWLPDRREATSSDLPRPSITDRLLASAAFGVPCAVSGVALLAFFWIFWGKASPSAPYGNLHSMDLSFLAAGGLGLLFDQEYGIVAVAPVLGLSLLGLVGMLRVPGPTRRVALEVGVVFGALLITVGAFRLWWGGSASAGRPVVAGLLLLVIPCAWQVRAWAGHPALRASAWALLAASLVVMVMFGFMQQGLLLITEKDGTSRLLSWLSPAWSLTSLGPTFILQSPAVASLVAAAWLALSGAGLAVLYAMPRRWRAGAASLAASTMAFVVLSAVAVAASAAAGSSATPQQDSSTRPRSPLLDDFDARRRPLVLVYDPIRRIPADAAPRMVHLVSRPGVARTLAVDSLLNRARWALPPGDYEVELSGNRGPLPPGGAVALQIGRNGPSLTTWNVSDTTGHAWRARFSLPVDVNFLGFKVSRDLQAVSPSVAIHPRTVRDRSARLPPLDVVDARRYDGPVVYFHDGNAAPQANGFWTRRDSSTQITVDPGDRRVRLRLRSGPVQTTVVVVQAQQDATTMALEPNAPRELSLAATNAPVRLEIDTHGGFVPAEVDPASPDTTDLGCWIEIVDGA